MWKEITPLTCLHLPENQTRSVTRCSSVAQQKMALCSGSWHSDVVQSAVKMCVESVLEQPATLALNACPSSHYVFIHESTDVLYISICCGFYSALTAAVTPTSLHLPPSLFKLAWQFCIPLSFALLMLNAYCSSG